MAGGSKKKLSPKELGERLGEAALIGEAKTVTSLLKEGADPNYADGEQQRTPMHGAAGLCDVNLCQLLMAAGGSVAARDRNGSTPLHLAARNWGAESAIKFLVAAGADVNAKDTAGRTPLHEAVVRGGFGNCRALVDLGADLFAENMEGKTPLAARHTPSRDGIEEMLAAEMLRAKMGKEIPEAGSAKGQKKTGGRGEGL